MNNDLFRDTVNFKTSWKEPISHYYECVSNGHNNRSAMRMSKRAFKMNKDEYNEFKRRVQAM